MTSASNNQGRAYEYAIINILHDSLSDKRNTRIVKNSSLDVNRHAWDEMPKTTKELFTISADSIVDTLLELEPMMVEDDNGELTLEFMQDDVGIGGDVRDIVVKRKDVKWEIGLSVKHNHKAIKHCRLSHNLDFGKSWFGSSCSMSYWNDIKPIFDRLKEEKEKCKKWSDIDDKEESVYIPLLNAFIKEIKYAYSLDDELPKKMVQYLIGIKDYYKIVSIDNKKLTMIYTFNIHGSLNKSTKNNVSDINVPIVELPDELVAIKMKKDSNNTVEMYLNNGWQLSFRIHNASTKVEPSLKFDIQFIGMPISILSIECKWK